MESNNTQSNSSRPKTKKYAAIGITAGLLLGAGGGLLMNLPGGVSAKSTTPQAISADTNSTTTKSADRGAKLRETLQALVTAGTIDASDVDAIVTALSTKPTTPPAADTTGAHPDKATMLKARLQTLVDDGTLTSSQLDAVVVAVEAARPMGGGMGEHGRGHGGPGHDGQNHGGARGEKRQEMLTAAADAIGWARGLCRAACARRSARWRNCALLLHGRRRRGPRQGAARLLPRLPGTLHVSGKAMKACPGIA